MSAVNGLDDQSQQRSVLPTFTSINDHREGQSTHGSHDGYPESSKASSSRSAASRSDDKSKQVLENASQRNNEHGMTPAHPDQHIAGSPALQGYLQGSNDNSLKKSKRASGGFLLDSPPAPSRLPRTLLSRKAFKGKQRPDDHTLYVARRRSHLPQGDGPSSSSPLQSSPLSSQLRSSPIPRRSSAQNGTTSFEEKLDNSSSLRSHATGSSPRQSYGMDTDPAQIVDMALRLSEGRRKQVADKRVASNLSEGRRVVSNATSVLSRSSPSPRSVTLKRKLIDPAVATPPKRTRDVDGDEEADVAIPATNPPLPEGWSPETTADMADDDLHISRATRNRVLKAKAYFELAHEHRRLLPHLPPIRAPEGRYNSESPGYDSKAYNPLQYVRNRKLRFRQRTAVAPESEGWHDVLKVRAWVDAVVRSHAETTHSPLECVRLPPLTLVEKIPNADDDSSNAGSRPPDPATKPKRPKSDWVTHPGDMIADAFWTEQAHNKPKVYNRDNELIYPTGTKFQFSGWRNRTPIDVPENLKQATPSPEASPLNLKKSVPAPPELPTFEHAHKDHSWAKTKTKFTKALNKRPRDPKSRGNDIFDTSSGSSDNDEQAEQNRPRGRRRTIEQPAKFDLPDGDPFAFPLRRTDSASTASSLGYNPSDKAPRKDSTDRRSLLRHVHRNSMSLGGTQSDVDKLKSGKRRRFLGNIRLDSDHEGARSSFDYDSTAPPTPAIGAFPSITINLSPPESRSPSPHAKKRGSFLGTVIDKVHGHKAGVDFTDFADEHHNSSRASLERSSRSYPKSSAYSNSRGPSPMSRGTSPHTRQWSQPSASEVGIPATDHRDSTISKASTRPSDLSSHRAHRVRGMFKGGRIAELVGHEVSRVGDYIWKREPPRKIGSNIESDTSSGYESDSDELTDSKGTQAKLLNRPDQPFGPKSPTNVKSAAPGSPPAKSSPGELPQYHIQGLPSFTSPFQRDKEEQDRRQTAQTTESPRIRVDDEDELDPISTGAANKAARSPRFDRLAPPRLDIRAATPDGRRSSYGFGVGLGLERARSASQLYNDAINESVVRRRDKNQPNESAELSRVSTGTELTKTLSSGSRIPVTKYVTRRDWARVQGLLLAVAIKATNIAKNADTIPRPQSSFIYSAFESTDASGSEIDSLLPARRRDEHVIAARHLISHLGSKSTIFNDRLSDFTRTTAVDLHREIQILGDNVDHSLFPRLQALSDTAGQLAQRLTTTSTLAVRGVSDEVMEAMRMRRRGPQRIGRWLAYKLIEWTVVGCLWCIWFAVTVVRFGIGSIRAMWAVTAWLFFWR